VLTQTGRYQVRAQFKTADGSVFKSCSGSAAFDIRSGQSPDDDPGTTPNGGDTPDGILPDTGGPHLLWLLLALTLVGSGGGLVYVARRRPRAPLYDV
jgi:LPXTG-motif cell wall-anchored protein